MIEVSKLHETEQHELLRRNILTKLRKWRSFVIAIDGVDDSGKSSLGRYLAWQAGVPLIETDLFLESLEPVQHRENHLGAAVNARLESNRPVIIEGVLILQTLERIKIKPDYLVVIEAQGRDGSRTLSGQFDAYRTSYQEALSTPDFRFSWHPDD